MARTCAICNKGPRPGNKYKRRGMVRRKGGAGAKIVGKTLRQFLPNLQRIKVVMNGVVKRLNICTTCIRSGRAVKA